MVEVTQPPPLAISRVEAARLLGVSERTLYNLTRRGEIPVVTIGRRKLYRQADVVEYLNRSTTTKE